MDDAPTLNGERWAAALLLRGPVVAAGAVTAVGLAAAVLVPFGLWRPVVALPTLAVGLALVWRGVRALPARGVPLWSGGLTLLAAAGHAGWAAATHAEHLVLRRDAGSYALFAHWIGTRHGLPVDARLADVGGAAALADPAFTLASPAYYQVVHGSGAGASADVVPQFLLATPALYSLGWWTAGWQGLLVAPAVTGGFAVLAAGALAARLAGPAVAPLAAAALGLAQPVLHASRSTYSEPPALLLVAVAAGLLVEAVRARGVLARRLAWAAGAGFGLAGLLRVDALREVVLLFPVVALLALRRHPAARPLLLGALTGTAVAAIPALALSRPYVSSIAGSLLPLLAGGVVLAAGSVAAVWWGRRRTPARPDPRRAPAAGWLAAGGVLLLSVGLALRPLWTVTRQSAADPGSRVVAGLQRQQGLPVDGGRTYAEHSVQWVVWWVGPVAALLGCLALAWLARLAVTDWWAGRPLPLWAGPLLVGLGSTWLTLLRPGITPDHPWADRRLVPVVLPTLVLAACAGVRWAARRAQRSMPAPLFGLAVGTGVVLLTGPAAVATAGVAGQRTERGELAAVRSVCAALGPDDVVLAVDARGRNEWPQVVRGVCGRPSASVIPAPPSRTAVAAAAGRIVAAGRRPVLLAADPERGESTLRGLGLMPREVTDLRTVEDQRLLTRRPAGGQTLLVRVWLAPWSPP